MRSSVITSWAQPPVQPIYVPSTTASRTLYYAQRPYERTVITSSAFAACATLSAPTGCQETLPLVVPNDNSTLGPPLSFPSIGKKDEPTENAMSVSRHSLNEPLKTPPPNSMAMQTFTTNQNIAPAPPAPAFPPQFVPVEPVPSRIHSGSSLSSPEARISNSQPLMSNSGEWSNRGALPPKQMTPALKLQVQAPHCPSIHSGNPAKPFQCTICGKHLASKNVFQLHLRSHSGEKPFSCQLCGNSFSQKTSLTRHMRSHTGERPFPCPVCQKRFADKERIKIHLRTHTGEKPFSCSECGKTFSQKSTVKRHMSVHTGEKPYKCEQCGKGFANRGNLTAHSKTHTINLP